LGHFWSLAVEEQFYLFWPFVVLWCPRAAMFPLFVFLIGFAGAVRWLLIWHDQALPAYVLMPSRLDALTAGSLLAMLAHEQRSISASALLGSGLTLLSTVWMPMVSAVTFEWGWILVNAAVIAWLSEAQDGATTRVLRARAMVYLGTISYGIYVWHRVIPEIVVWFEERYDVWSRFPHEPGLTRLAVVGLSAVLVSVCSWHFFERPVNDLKRRFPYVSRGANREPANLD
jgi:peptidoglycan/LPS O-acetylase OafA/YrhL